jgi:hypothetical protein
MERKPTIRDRELGDLHYDSSLDWYEIEARTRFGLADVSLDREEYSSADELVADLRAFCRGLESIREEAFAEIVKTMVPLKNECWLDDHEKPISADELLAAVESQQVSISLSKGGLAEMFFNDGGSFGGHSIVVWHSEDGTVDGAHLAG